MSHHEPAQPPKSGAGKTLSRRRFLQGGLAAAATASLALPLGSSDAATVQPSLREAPPKPTKGKGPNILIILCDEMRFPPVYESDTTKQFRQNYLRFQDALRENGLDFQRHYVMAAACVPSRASIVTGHYPSLHGVSQTVGGCKEDFEPDTFWLDPNSVPTLGNYFRAAGYLTFWVGKWHASAANMLIPGTHDKLPSYDDSGARDPDKEALYKAANRLNPYGFAGWIGPEPHGSSPLDSGSSVPPDKRGRDVSFAEQAQELIQELDQHPSSAPWLVVCSFTNPHDICCWGLLEQYPDSGYEFYIGSEVPAADKLFTSGFQDSFTEDLSQKPSAQASYRDKYHIFQQPIVDVGKYHQYYYQLLKNVDEQMNNVFQALLNSVHYKDNTIVVFTSDHGELLSAHGDMHQKFYQAYEETTRVPLMVWGPSFFAGQRSIDTLTSHADLAPTLLGLAGIDAAHQEEIRQALAVNHSDAAPFVGRDLSRLITGEADPATFNDPVYFMTDDDVDKGLFAKRRIGVGFYPVVEPNSVETVIARLDDGHLWKFSRTFDNKQYWSSPDADTPEDVLQVQLERDPDPTPQEPPPWTAVPFDMTVKNEPVGDEFEMYNLDDDPRELTNRYGDPAYLDQQTALAQLLEEQRNEKRLTPCSGAVPSQDCNPWGDCAAVCSE
jgi:choline-sulfatase